MKVSIESSCSSSSLNLKQSIRKLSFLRKFFYETFFFKKVFYDSQGIGIILVLIKVFCMVPSRLPYTDGCLMMMMQSIKMFTQYVKYFVIMWTSL